MPAAPGRFGGCDGGGRDGEGRGGDAEERGGADVVQRLHQGEARAERDRRPGERQRDPEEDRAAPGAERLGGFDQTRRLHEEEGAGRQVDVGAEDEAEEDDAAGKRADLGEGEVARMRQAEDGAKRGLHRADRMKDVEIGVGDDVGRDRQRQEERPVEDAAAGEFVSRHQPGGAGADGDDEEADAEQEDEGDAEGDRNDILDEMRPEIAGTLRGDQGKSNDRGKNEDGNRAGGGEPDGAAGAAPAVEEEGSPVFVGVGHGRPWPYKTAMAGTTPGSSPRACPRVRPEGMARL